MSEGLRRWKPQPATVISLVALFVALAGSAYAATLSKNSVKSKHIKDGQVKTNDIADLGVATTDLADGSVTTPKLGAAAVGTANIADNAVNSAKVAADTLAAGDLAPNSVGNSEIADNAVANAELADNAANSAEIAADSVGSSELAADSVSGNELVQSHTHAGNVVVVNDPANIDGDWTEGAVSTADCGINETILSATLTWTTAGDELATQQLSVDPTTANGTATGIGISDDGGAKSYRVDAICIIE